MSHVVVRHKKKDPQTNELQGLIDTWLKMHHRSTSGWVNEAARLDHESLVAEKAAQTRCATSTSGGSALVDETEILKKVLGERRGHIRGQGRKIIGGTSLGGQMS